MAWIVFALENTLVEQDPMTGQPTPIEGAPEAVMNLAGQGHRVTVQTSQFAKIPPSRRNDRKMELQEELASMGFPPELEVWSGMDRPQADLIIDRNAVTYDGDWNLALAHVQVELEERGLAPGPMPDDGSLDVEEEPVQGPEGEME